MMAKIGSEELAGVVDEIFGSMAGVQLAPSAALIAPDRNTGYITSAVQIVGDWQAAVRLDMDLELARRVCANLMDVDANDLSPQDIRDAAGELANMTGGSVKTLCAPTCGLSLPTVVTGRDYEFSLAQGTLVQASSFRHECGALTVSIIERQQPSEETTLTQSQ
jgi:chemotaxis protein CheX